MSGLNNPNNNVQTVDVELTSSYITLTRRFYDQDGKQQQQQRILPLAAFHDKKQLGSVKHLAEGAKLVIDLGYDSENRIIRLEVMNNGNAGYDLYSKIGAGESTKVNGTIQFSGDKLDDLFALFISSYTANGEKEKDEVTIEFEKSDQYGPVVALNKQSYIYGVISGRTILLRTYATTKIKELDNKIGYKIGCGNASHVFYVYEEGNGEYKISHKTNEQSLEKLIVTEELEGKKFSVKESSPYLLQDFHMLNPLKMFIEAKLDLNGTPKLILKNGTSTDPASEKTETIELNNVLSQNGLGEVVLGSNDEKSINCLVRLNAKGEYELFQYSLSQEDGKIKVLSRGDFLLKNDNLDLHQVSRFSFKAVSEELPKGIEEAIKEFDKNAKQPVVEKIGNINDVRSSAAPVNIDQNIQQFVQLLIGEQPNTGRVGFAEKIDKQKQGDIKDQFKQKLTKILQSYVKDNKDFADFIKTDNVSLKEQLASDIMREFYKSGKLENYGKFKHVGKEGDLLTRLVEAVSAVINRMFGDGKIYQEWSESRTKFEVTDVKARGNDIASAITDGFYARKVMFNGIFADITSKSQGNTLGS